MKTIDYRIILFSFVSFYLISCAIKNTENTNEPQDIFKKEIAEKVISFIKNEPICIKELENHEKKVFSLTKFYLLNATYDVKKTDSLISPLNGFLILDYQTQDNSKCGDIKGVDGFSYSAIEKSLENQAENCFTIHGGNPPQKVMIKANFLDKKWKISDIILLKWGDELDNLGNSDTFKHLSDLYICVNEKMPNNLNSNEAKKIYMSWKNLLSNYYP